MLVCLFQELMQMPLCEYRPLSTSLKKKEQADHNVIAKLRGIICRRWSNARLVDSFSVSTSNTRCQCGKNRSSLEGFKYSNTQPLPINASSTLSSSARAHLASIWMKTWCHARSSRGPNQAVVKWSEQRLCPSKRRGRGKNEIEHAYSQSLFQSFAFLSRIPLPK